MRTIRAFHNDAAALFFAALLSVGAMGAPRVFAEVAVGQEAPDFSLPATTGGEITLSHFRGKKNVLLEFYEVDFEPV